MDFFVKMNTLKVYFDSLYNNLVESNKKLAIFSFQSQFFSLKINAIIHNMIFVLEYQIRRKNFSENFFSFIHGCQNLFYKNVLIFWWLSIKLFCKISKNTLRSFIRIQKSSEFPMTHQEIPQLSK